MQDGHEQVECLTDDLELEVDTGNASGTVGYSHNDNTKLKDIIHRYMTPKLLAWLNQLNPIIESTCSCSTLQDLGEKSLRDLVASASAFPSCVLPVAKG